MGRKKKQNKNKVSNINLKDQNDKQFIKKNRSIKLKKHGLSKMYIYITYILFFRFFFMGCYIAKAILSINCYKLNAANVNFFLKWSETRATEEILQLTLLPRCFFIENTRKKEEGYNKQSWLLIAILVTEEGAFKKNCAYPRDKYIALPVKHYFDVFRLFPYMYRAWKGTNFGGKKRLKKKCFVLCKLFPFYWFEM